MATLLVMAVATQAAQISWNCGGGSGLAANGYVYAFTGTSANRTTVLNLLAGSVVADFNTYYNGLTYVGTEKTSTVPADSHLAMGKAVTVGGAVLSSSIYATPPNAFVGSSQQGMFYVMFNNADYTKATQFAVSTVQVQALLATGAKAYSTTWANWGGTGVSGTTMWTAVVPEPTSMALLALGVAAVGLRRRFKK